jgi:hypothetical protein
MKFRKTKKKAAPQKLDPAVLADEQKLKRQRFLMARALRKRRQRKSHQ